jgi:hypothetical protein
MTPPPPSGLSYGGPVTANVGVPMTALSPSATGSVSSYSVSPALPAGIAIDPVTGTISGTPTAVTAQADYTITASNAYGSTTFSLSLKVDPQPPSAYSLSKLVSDGTVAAASTDPHLKNPGDWPPAWRSPVVNNHDLMPSGL